MSKVKGSQQYRMKVVPHRPFYHFFRNAIALTLLIVAVLASGYLGHDKGMRSSGLLETENQQLKRLYKEKAIEVEELEQQVTNLKLGSEVDRQAGEDIRAEMVTLKARVAELEQETAFYRGLMKPTADNSGLTIGSLDIIKKSTPRRYQYKLVMQQLATQHQLLKGYLEFTIIGRQLSSFFGDTNLEKQKIPLRDISQEVSVVRMPLRFKYFQRFEGELELPKEFEPEYIEIKAVSTGKGGTVVEKKFSWLVQET